MTTKVQQYNKIYRWDKDFNTEMKKSSIIKLNKLLNSDNLQKRNFVINVIKELIDFKIARQDNDIISQEESLNNLTILCDGYKDFNIKPEELMKLVRHQSYLFQRGLPNTFKNFLQSIQLTKNEIKLFHNQQDFLNKNDIILQLTKEKISFKFNLFVGSNDSIENQKTLLSKHNIWNTPSNLFNYSAMINNSSGLIFTPNMFFNDSKKLENLINQKIPIIIIYDDNQIKSEIINYFLENNYPFINSINNIHDDFNDLLSLFQEKYDLDNKNKAENILSEWLNKLKNNFQSDKDLLNAYKVFKNNQNQKDKNSQYNSKQNQSNYNQSNNYNKKQNNLDQNISEEDSAINIFRKYIKEYNEKNKDNEKMKKIIDINEKASDKDLKKVYYNLSVYFHPDKNGNKEKMQEINKAKEILITAN